MAARIHINASGLVCALGNGREAVARGLFADHAGGLSQNTRLVPGHALMVGLVEDLQALPEEVPLLMRSRNNALLEMALQQIAPAVQAAIARYGATRVAVILGTSTSGIGEAEEAMIEQHHTGHRSGNFHYGQQEMGDCARFVRHRCGAQGPAWVISTACSSSAKAMISAARLLRAGVVDAVVAGGADSLCRFTIEGFRALASVCETRSNPFSRHRSGINIGEGAALFLMTREHGGVELAGWGETSDAHHMSAPDPTGRGAAMAIRKALDRAGWLAEQVDYINLHGTGTLQNDAMESLAVADVLGHRIAASSTKPMTGHTLGASGAIEAALCILLLTDNPGFRLPPHWWDGQADESLPELALVAPGASLGRPPRRVLSQSFAFGGSNAVLALSTAQGRA